MWIPRSRDPSICVALLLCACAAAGAVDSAAERARIERERATAEARARDGRAACASTFSVNACLKRVDTARRDDLRRLDRQRVLLDESQRKERAARRMTRIQQRQAARERETTRPPLAPAR
jgi:hypothetical protein